MRQNDEMSITLVDGISISMPITKLTAQAGVFFRIFLEKVSAVS